jgi:hypothetical protein
MSFGEYVFPAGFHQKTTKGDIFIKRNYGIASWELRGKVLEAPGGSPPRKTTCL